MQYTVYSLLVFSSTFQLAFSALSVRGSQRFSDFSAYVDAGSADERQKTLAEDRLFWSQVANGTGSALRHLEHFASLQTSGSRAPADAAADLGDMSGILDGMYEQCKERIVEINHKETLSKQRFAKESGEHDSRVAAIDAEFHAHEHVPKAMQASEIALKAHLQDESDYFQKYWGRVRERNHKQFHTFLKIQHGLMDKLKTMKDAYSQASQGAPPPAEEAEVTMMLQHQRLERQDAHFFAATLSFVKESLSELNARVEELKLWD